MNQYVALNIDLHIEIGYKRVLWQKKIAFRPYVSFK